MTGWALSVWRYWVLLSITWQKKGLADNLPDARAKGDKGFSLQELRVDGGASANNLLTQMQADFSGAPVVRPKVTETTALGAAYLAGLAVDFSSSTDEIASQWQVDRRFEPQMSADAGVTKLARWHKAVAWARDWADG